METIRLMQSKLHRVTVTETHQDYMGSVTIDGALMDRVGILPLQEVDIVNVNNGNRISTYAIPGEPHSGIICLNGAAAQLFNVGEIAIIFTFVHRDRKEVMKQGHQAKVLIADRQNKCEEFLVQTLNPQDNNMEFTSITPKSAPSNWSSPAFFHKN